MPFQNPIVGQTELIRKDIESRNYVEGESGWRIARDGDAEFNDLTTRGVASGPSATYDIISTNEQFWYQGDELSAIQEKFSKGMVARGWTDDTSQWIYDSDLVCGYVTFPAKKGRMYLVLATIIVQRYGPSTYFVGYLRYADAVSITPTDTSIADISMLLPSDGDISRVMAATHIKSSEDGYMAMGLSGHSQASGSGGVRLHGYTDKPSLSIEVLDMGIINPSNNLTTGIAYSNPQNGKIFNQHITYPISCIPTAGHGTDYDNVRWYVGQNNEMNTYTEITFATEDLLFYIIGLDKSDIVYLDLYLYCYNAWFDTGLNVSIGYKDINDYVYPDIIHTQLDITQGKWISIKDSIIAGTLRTGYFKSIVLKTNNTDHHYYGYGNGHLSTTGPGTGPQIRMGYML